MKHDTIQLLNKLSLIVLGAVITAAIFLFLFSGLWKYRELNKTLDQVSKANYDITAYNCIDFSLDAVDTLKSKNINSNVVVIKKDPNSKQTHAVIGVWIDPQDGQIVSGSQYVGDYSELKNQFGWAK